HGLPPWVQAALLLHRRGVDNEVRPQSNSTPDRQVLKAGAQHLHGHPITVHSCKRQTSGLGMNVIEKPTARMRIATSDLDGDLVRALDRFRLRRFIESLAGTEELERRDTPIDLADIAKVLDGNPRAVHFLAAGSEQQELVGNVMSSRSRIAR